MSKKLIDKDALVAEIDFILNETNYKPFTDEVLGERKVCRDIKDFLNTIEIKEVDLEKEATKIVQSKEFIESKESPILLIAKHFFELGLKLQKE